MAALRDAIRQFELQPAPQPRPAPLKAAEVRAALEERLGRTGVKQPDTERMLRAYRALKEAAADPGSGMQSLSIANLKHAPWVLFKPVDDATAPLAADKDLVVAYLKEVIARARASVTVALLAAFVMAYPTQLPVFHALRRDAGPARAGARERPPDREVAYLR